MRYYFRTNGLISLGKDWGNTYATANDLKTAFAAVPIQFVYKLATPITYTLTALEVLETLKGVNNIWADCGNTSVTYRADTKAYVDNASPEVPVQDVQVNGTSILQNGVANVPIAGSSFGVVRLDGGLGISIVNGYLYITAPIDSDYKSGVGGYKPVVPSKQHLSTFYGLAKAAGDSTQSASSNAVGTYTETARSKIHDMLDAPVSVSGTTPSITALPGVRYVCGEVATLDVTVPASGIIDVVFESGSTATVLTITGTVKWANGFDPTALDANTTYEINIADGLGVAASWT